MAIGLQQHRKTFTLALVAVFSDNKAPLQGLSAFFPSKTSRAKGVSIKVRRNRQLVAVDVQRCTDPHRNLFSSYQEKIFIPPFYHEVVDFTSCQGYDVTFGSGAGPNEEQVDILMTDSSDQVLEMKYMIQRAIEKARASILQHGVVTLKNGDSIDYHRQAASMPVLTGSARWNQFTTANPIADFTTAGNFLRQQGLSTGNELNAICGSSAIANLLSFSSIQTERQIFSNFRRADIGMPVLNTVTGLTYYGRVGAGDYIVNLWSYSDFYEDSVTGVKSNYIDPNNVVILPTDFEGVTAFAGIPAVMDYDGAKSVMPVEGEFLVYDTIDEVKTTWDFNVKSAPLPVPVSIDRIYSIQTV